MCEYYYHYTSLASLALIIKTKSILLNSLDKMDDVEDGKTNDFNHARKYVFCSSWTTQKDDLNFWSMYGANMHGVCIGLCKDPFEYFEWKNDHYSDNKIIIPRDNYYLPEDKALGEKYTVAVPFKGMFFTKVEYSDKREELYPDIVNWKNDTSSLEVNFGKVGLFKHKAWRNQQEWRYRVVCFPTSYENMLTSDSEGGGVYNDMQKGIELPIPYIHLTISEKALNTMQIIKGPKMSDGEQLLLESFLKQYCPDIKVSPSELHMRCK